MFIRRQIGNVNVPVSRATGFLSTDGRQRNIVKSSDPDTIISSNSPFDAKHDIESFFIWDEKLARIVGLRIKFRWLAENNGFSLPS